MNIFFESNGFKDLDPKTEGIYYERFETSGGKVVIDTSKPLDKDGKPLIVNPEIHDVIENRS